MQGRLLGKRCTPSSSSRSRSSTGSRAATTCSRWRWRWTRSPATRSRAGSAATATSARPDLATLRRIPWLEGTALVLGDVAWHDGSPVAALAAPGAEGPGRARGGARLRADVRLRARVLPAQGDLRRGAREALPRPDAVRPVHPRLPRARDDVRRAVHPPAAQRHARGRDPGRELEGRGVARAAGDQLPLRRRGHDGRQPRDLQERREGARAPERDARSRSWRSPTTRGSATRATSTGRSGATARRVHRRGGVFGGASRAGSSARGARGLPRAERELVQALRGRARGRRRRSRGARTTARAASGSSGTGARAASRRASPAAT